MVERCVNPFYHRFKFRKCDYIKIFFGTIFLVPIRLVFILILFALTSIIAKVSNYLLDKWKLEKQKELEWRHFFQRIAEKTFKAVFFVSGIYETKIIDKGSPYAEKEAPIIVIAPHTSPFDILIVVVLGIPSVVARQDTVDIPLFGSIIKLIDPVFVERESKSSRNSVIYRVLEKIKYSRIAFFPEATCYNRRGLGQFKPGAFMPGLPVQPVVIRYDQFGGPDTLSWAWDGPPVLVSIWLTLCRWKTGFELTKLPVYYPTEEEKSDPDLYANNVSELFSKELGIPKLKYSFDDVKYIRYRVFKSPVCLKFLKLCDKIANQTKLEIKNKINDKNRIFCETVNDVIRDVIQNIELSPTNDIKSIDDLILLLNLDKYSEVSKSNTLMEFYDCIENTALNINTKHLAIVLQLCDMNVMSFWLRLENSFNLLINSGPNCESISVSNESVEQLLWLAFGLKTERKLTFLDKQISFDKFKQIILSDFVDCIEENGRELLEERL